MSVYLNGRAVAQPVRNGTPYNALHNGRKVWVDPKDKITSVVVVNADGKPAPTSLPIDGSVTLAAQATYGDGHKGELLTTKGVSFETTTPDFVTIESNKVMWKHGGTAVITATIDGAKSGPVSITCAYKPESVTVSSGGKPVTALTLAKGATATIDVSVLPAEASQDVTVTSDHPDIVVVAEQDAATDAGMADAAILKE